ncbi:hypothetical protein BBJ28_00000412 [Nothophytophthora sp. Chile5]|nr:hypothetical protein BBJ28_00000412 [Nothophytophthora sp. Chile5]
MQAVGMTAAETRREKWSFLGPWCDALRGLLATEGRFTEHSALGEYWWVTVRLPASASVDQFQVRDVRLLREALELLSLVALVDNEAWKQLLLECCQLKLDDENDTLDGDFAPRFLFQFDAAHLRYSALLPSTICRQFFLPRLPPRQDERMEDGCRASKGYQHALETILAFHRAAGGTQETVKKWRKIPYALHFVDLWGQGQPTMSAHLSYFLATLDEIRKHNAWLLGENDGENRLMLIDEAGNEAHGPPIRSEDDGSADGHYFAYDLESVQLCLGTIQISRELPNVLLTMLGMPRVAFSELQLSLEQDPQTGYFPPGQVHPRILAAHHRCGMLFNAMFCGKSITTRPNDQPQGVRRCAIESVVIPFFGMDDQIFSGLCCSLAEASMVRKLTLNGAFTNLTSAQRTWRWQWLAYALFSDASRSSIETLQLMGVRLSVDDVDAIAEVLSTNVPEPGVAPIAAETTHTQAGRPIEFVNTEKDTYIRMKESIASHNESTFMETVDGATFRVLQDDGESEWIHVLVPGRGNGLIARDRGQKVNLEDPLQPHRAPGGITSLSLSIDIDVEQGAALLPRLLHLIGRSLRMLSIRTIGSATLDFRAILQACPDLEQLFLDSVQIDLDAFMLKLESGNATIRCFGLAYFNAPTDVLTRFAEKLGDPSSTLANGMHELCLSADNEEMPMTDESVQAFLNVLESNHTLAYLDLLVLPALFDKYSADFVRHHQEPLAVEKEKLPLRCRLAFLSIVRGRGAATKGVMQQLDNHILTKIFDFAAICAKRTVCLRCDH